MKTITASFWVQFKARSQCPLATAASGYPAQPSLLITPSKRTPQKSGAAEYWFLQIDIFPCSFMSHMGKQFSPDLNEEEKQ